VAETLGLPRAATVIAIGLKVGAEHPLTPAATRLVIANLLAGALTNSCHLQSASGAEEPAAFTAILPDDSQVLALIRRLQSVQAEFHETHHDVTVHYVIHHGVVFPGPKGYIGSAMRSAHSRLARLPADIPCAATIDFAAFTETWASRPIVFRDYDELPLNLGLLAYSLTDAMIAGAGRSLDQAALLTYLTSRLADYLGPFAEVLVDAARRSSSNTNQLIEDLAREIDDPHARHAFQSDVRAFLGSFSPT